MTELATLGGGCFWCLEAVYEQIRGVEGVTSGYAGGHVSHPSYEQVCSKQTGHAEVIQLRFQPDVISYKTLLDIFFSIHDPTTLNRQGHDVGPQYRSVIFYHDDEQKRIAEEMIASLEQQKVFSNPIVTEVQPLTNFYPAEDYHQGYYRSHPGQSYCVFVVAPKVQHARQQFPSWLKS